MKDLLQIVHELGHMSSAEADDAITTFSELRGLAQTKYKKLFANFDRTDQNLDVFYSKILACDGKQAALWKVVRMVLTLSHGQASVESGFSINKELLIENMEEETIVAQRIVFDAVRLSDMDVTKIDISQKMMACVRQSLLHTSVLFNLRRTSRLKKRNMQVRIENESQ